MLFESGQGLINVFIEPQFAQICDEPLFTVQAAGLRALETLELHPLSDKRIDVGKFDFLFMGFAYSWNLEHCLTLEKISSIPTMADNLNEIPTAYCWTGRVIDLESVEWDEHDEMIIGDLQTGYCFRQDLQRVREEKRSTLEEFRAFPLFRYPTREELKTIWVS